MHEDTSSTIYKTFIIRDQITCKVWW